MSVCWEEERIERGAIRWAAEESSGDATVSNEMAGFLDHARGCRRCADLLALFLETERRVLAEASIGCYPLVAAGPNVVDLEEISERVLRRAPLRDPEGADFSLAAQHAGPAAERRDDGRAEAARSFASRDGLYLVRVLPIESGSGRTAVLLVDETAGRPGRALLRFGGGEYPFDDSGHAVLPETPAGRVQLVFL
ncbi:MAG: hypothetical protein ABIH26_07855 [Candidatus Eisenbacteria bacterium]